MIKIDKLLFLFTFFFLSAFSSFGSEAFLNAVKSGDVDSVKQWLSKDSALVWAVSSDGNLPLHHAVADQNAEMIQVLIEKGAEPRAGRTDGVTPLMLAVTSGRVPIVKALLGFDSKGNYLRRGSLYGAKEMLSGEEIELARKSGHGELVTYLQDLQDPRDALHKAVVSENEKRVNDLLLKFPDVLRSKEFGDSILRVAVRFGDKNIMKALVDAGADTAVPLKAIGHGPFFEYLNEAWKSRETFFYNALREGDAIAVRSFMAYYSTEHIKQEDADYILNFSIQKGNQEIVQILLERLLPTYSEKKLLMEAVRLGHIGIVKELLGILDSGRVHRNQPYYENPSGPVISDEVIAAAQINRHEWLSNYLLQIRDSRASLRAAVQSGDEQQVQKWVDLQSEVNYRGGNDPHLLIEAARLGHIGVVKALVAAGAEVDAEKYITLRISDKNCCSFWNFKQKNAMRYLCKVAARRLRLLTAIKEKSDLAIIEGLIKDLKYKVDFPVFDVWGEAPLTPLRLAVKAGYCKVVEKMVLAGVIPNQQMIDTALDEGHYEVARLLTSLVYGKEGIAGSLTEYVLEGVAELISSYLTDIPVPKKREKPSERRCRFLNLKRAPSEEDEKQLGGL